MKRRTQAKGFSGFTIVETMIVLAVTSAMFIVAMLAFNGQQEKTRFTQANRDFESKMRDIANDISTGYFPDQSGVQCSASGTGVSFVPSGSAQQGTNDQCIFLGKAVRLTGCTGGCKNLAIEVVAGRRQDSGEEVTTLAQARPTVATAYSDSYTMQYGLVPKKVVNAGGTLIAGFALMSSLAGYQNGDPVSGSQSSSLYGINEGVDFNGQVGLVRDSNLTSKVTICLSNDAAGNNGRKAALTISDTSSGIVTDVVLDGVPEVCNA